MMKSYFQNLANYNHCMNQNIIEAMSRLPDHEIYEDKGAFFASIFGTMVHVFVADLIWLRRFEVFHPPTFAADIAKFPIPKSLDDAIFGDFASFASSRLELDELIIGFVSGLSNESFEAELKYKNTKGTVFRKKFGEVLGHFFNHQTHHRGQVSTLLFQSNIDIGITDLISHIPDL